jgi:uncharacterized glyoxalase superfamily protein PhnB
MADWRAPLISAVCYQDPKAALKFLEAAFGFELVMLIEDDQGNLAHSEMRFGDAAIMVGNEWSDDIDAHCERARAAGFEIIMEPATQFYGDRTYRCRDPEGHIWTIGQTVNVVSREDAEAASGLKITGWI